MLRDEFGKGDQFVEKITGSPTVDRPLQRIREFRNRPEPGIAVTVDWLSTGVDIPALENIVLLRPIKSRILFEQILGRGARKDAFHRVRRGGCAGVFPECERVHGRRARQTDADVQGNH